MTLLVYGSYGYTGRRVVREAADRPLDLVVAGRDSTEVQHQAATHGVEGRVFSVDEDVAAHLADVDAVLNCAGPFKETAGPLVDACLATGTDYLDITGEVEVFEALAARNEEAADADVTVLPGVGFDVVPTDCLAAHLAERMPDASEIALAFDSLGPVSPGTAATAVEQLGEGGLVRRDSAIEHVPTAWTTREVDFGDGRRTTVSIPWGDVATAYYTTGIPNVTFYVGMPMSAVWALRASRPLEPLFQSWPVRRTLRSVARTLASGPSGRRLEQGETRVWGEVRGDSGALSARLTTPNPYALTVDASVAAAERVLDGDAPAGYTTPAGAFGPEFVLSLPGVEGYEDVGAGT